MSTDDGSPHRFPADGRFGDRNASFALRLAEVGDPQDNGVSLDAFKVDRRGAFGSTTSRRPVRIEFFTSAIAGASGLNVSGLRSDTTNTFADQSAVLDSILRLDRR